jgi:uncharacterized protein (DUF2267 family)
MSLTGLAPFDSTIHTTNAWLHDLMETLGWTDKHHAYQTLRVVLHALRDRLSVDEAAALAAQLPLLIRGVFYEGWHPHGKPLKQRTREAFLQHITVESRDLPYSDPEVVARAVFRVLARHVTAGEVESVKNFLPAGIRSLWEV